MITLDQTVTFCAGAIVGYLARTFIDHNLAKSRDKESRHTKDFNEAAEIMSEILRKEKSYPTPGSNLNFSTFRRFLSKSELQRFNNCVEEYEKARTEQKNNVRSDFDEGCLVSPVYYLDATSIKAAIDKLLQLTERK